MPNEKEYIKPFAALINADGGNDPVGGSFELEEDELIILNRKGSKN